MHPPKYNNLFAALIEHFFACKILQKNIAVNSGKTDFNIFQHQDATDVLSCILDQLFSVGVADQNMINVSIKITITCEKCHQDNIK